MTNNLLDDIIKNHDFTLTPLRKEVLTVILNIKGFFKAYDIIAELSKIRGETKPITIYRVLNFLVEMKVLHKIASINAFILCSDSLSHNHKDNNIFLICKKCNNIHEVFDDEFFNDLRKFYTRYHFIFNKNDIELNGYCKECVTK
jgi:Fur family transcriptional regulator, zinc uptake regulator